MPCTERSVSPAYLLETAPGTHFAVSSGSCSFNFATKWLTQKLSCNLITVISAACDLNEHGGKHRLLQTPPQRMSK